jgi:hypothetical protein
MSSDRAS